MTDPALRDELLALLDEERPKGLGARRIGFETWLREVGWR
jgi:hypothetical protein